MSEERIIETDNLSVEARRVYKSVTDVIKNDDRLCLDLAEDRRGHVVGGGWEIQCNFSGTPILIEGNEKLFPMSIMFSADSEEDVTRGDYVKEKVVEILGVEPNKRFFKKKFRDESIYLGNLENADILRFYFFGGKVTDGAKRETEPGYFSRSRVKLNKTRACLETLAIIEGRPYSSERYINLPVCRVQNGHDWEQWKDHPCNRKRKKRG